MQRNSGCDVKACQSCGVLNRVPDGETRPEIIHCDACGQHILLNGVPSVIGRIIRNKISRRTFNKAIPYLLAPFYTKVFEYIFFPKKKSGQQARSFVLHVEPRLAKASGSSVAMTIIRNEADVGDTIIK